MNEEALSQKEVKKIGRDYLKLTEDVLTHYGIYLKENKKISDKIFNRDMDIARDYLMSYLLSEGLETPIFSLEELYGLFLSIEEDFGTAEDAKPYGISLRKFYKFLYEVKSMTEEEWKEAKEMIAKGLKLFEEPDDASSIESLRDFLRGKNIDDFFF